MSSTNIRCVIRYTAALAAIREFRMQIPETVEVNTGADPVGCVIWLHGLGADGHDFEPIVPELGLPDTLPLRFVFPHAPTRPVTINGGMSMRAWYDILSLDKEGPADEDGIRDSSDLLDALIRRELERGMDSARIVLAGFSQGGAIVLHNALRTELKLAGLMALSTYLPLRKTLDAEVVNNPQAGNTSLPVFMAHGSLDPMIPIEGGRDSADVLETLGYSVEWHDYPMAHAVCPQEIADISRWLSAVYES
jgi:phospholipase/carboxylesterase